MNQIRYPLTKRQGEILQYIKHYIRDNSYAPTIEEIGVNFKLNAPSTVHEHLENLVYKGYIERERNGARGISIIYKEIVPRLRKQGLSEDDLKKVTLVLRENGIIT